MSATFSNSSFARPPAGEIWSRGGGCLRRLVWKELSEVVGLFGAFALGILVTALWARFHWVTHREVFSLQFLLLYIAGVVYPMIVGSRAFAKEIERGTWELLRSAGASAWDVWLSKLLVAFLSSVGISLLSGLAISMSLSLGIASALVGGWLKLTLVLAVSMQCSLWLRKTWLAMIASTVIAVLIVHLTDDLATGWVHRRLSELPHSETFGFQMLSDLFLSALVLFFVALLWTTQLWKLRRELLDHPAIHDAQRWNKVFWRMLWKELLAVRDFWLSVLGILIVLEGCAFWSFRESSTRDSAIVALDILLPLLHSLGCGAIAFSLEREDGTQDWLRRISAPAGAVFAAKLLVSQASIVSLTSLVLLGPQTVVWSANRLTHDGCATLLMAVTFNGVVGLGASLLTRRVLPAVFLAFVGVLAIDFPLLLSGFGVANKGQPFSGFPLALLPWWLLVGTALLAAEWYLADRWLNERRWWPRRWRGETPRATLSRGPEFWFDWSSSPEKKLFGRLMWREWMEAKGWLWTLPMVFAPAVNHNLMDNARGGGPRLSWAIEFLLVPASGLVTFGLFVLPALLGVWAFHHDQRQGLFRFLTDRGGSPRQIWWSKQAVWLSLVFALSASASVIFELQLFPYPQRGQLIGLSLLFALQSYAAGQAMSQWNRSALISMFLASMLSLLLWGWTVLLAGGVRAPWPYQFGAVAILFFASWRSSRDWLEERWSWRAWLQIILSVALPFVTLVLILELHGYRVWNVLRNWTGFR